MASLSPYARHVFSAESSNNSWSNMYGYIPDGSKVLDVGCSTGNFGEALEKLKGCIVTGVDINEADVAAAKKKITAAHVLDITQPGARDLLGVFDVIVYADVIEHLPNPKAALEASLELLAPGGVVVYSIPNMGHVSVRLDLLEGRFPYTALGLLDRTHLHFYDRREVHDVFESSGYMITSERPTVSSYPQSWVAERLQAIGLDASPGFFAMLSSTESHVYQYIGTAEPYVGSAREPRPALPEISPPDEILERAERLQAENDRLNADLTDLHSRFTRFRRNPVAGVVRELTLLRRRRRDRATD